MISWLIGTLIVGLIVGAIARLLMPGRDSMGCLATSLLGIAGSFVGGIIGRALLGPRPGYWHPGFLLSIIGAVLVLWILRMVRRA
ncbi:MAG: GlsB/YeaQ/YmgE family stress response membrane protein [Blastocatellia bacterium AA13]|nr:MAG: GlsB/YeaQ/YmgE family stress response membrane protein [Blastocatellia bacterium AA13]